MNILVSFCLQTSILKKIISKKILFPHFLQNLTFCLLIVTENLGESVSLFCHTLQLLLYLETINLWTLSENITVCVSFDSFGHLLLWGNPDIGTFEVLSTLEHHFFQKIIFNTYLLCFRTWVITWLCLNSPSLSWNSFCAGQLSVALDISWHDLSLESLLVILKAISSHLNSFNFLTCSRILRFGVFWPIFRRDFTVNCNFDSRIVYLDRSEHIVFLVTISKNFLFIWHLTISLPSFSHSVHHHHALSFRWYILRHTSLLHLTLVRRLLRLQIVVLELINFIALSFRKVTLIVKTKFFIFL